MRYNSEARLKMMVWCVCIKGVYVTHRLKSHHCYIAAIRVNQLLALFDPMVNVTIHNVCGGEEHSKKVHGPLMGPNVKIMVVN